jgi:hypothetical protein
VWPESGPLWGQKRFFSSSLLPQSAQHARARTRSAPFLRARRRRRTPCLFFCVLAMFCARPFFVRGERAKPKASPPSPLVHVSVCVFLGPKHSFTSVFPHACFFSTWKTNKPLCEKCVLKTQNLLKHEVVWGWLVGGCGLCRDGAGRRWSLSKMEQGPSQFSMCCCAQGLGEAAAPHKGGGGCKQAAKVIRGRVPPKKTTTICAGPYVWVLPPIGIHKSFKV